MIAITTPESLSPVQVTTMWNLFASNVANFVLTIDTALTNPNAFMTRDATNAINSMHAYHVGLQALINLTSALKRVRRAID
jgi:hypothetical protein